MTLRALHFKVDGCNPICGAAGFEPNQPDDGHLCASCDRLLIEWGRATGFRPTPPIPAGLNVLEQIAMANEWYDANPEHDTRGLWAR